VREELESVIDGTRSLELQETLLSLESANLSAAGAAEVQYPRVPSQVCVPFDPDALSGANSDSGEKAIDYIRCLVSGTA